MFGFWLYAATMRKLDAWSVAAGMVLMAGSALVYVIRNDAPQHVLNWQRGAEGERRTEKALRPLERAGWSVEHDVQRARGSNIDHIVRGPHVAFLLETKNLAGTITFENGILCARQWDDPDEVFRYSSLASRVRGQAKEVSARIRRETGRGKWVEGVVVVWGDFPLGLVDHEEVTYIAGERLRSWLLEIDSRPRG
jgi:Nuclease-related domain